MEFTEASYPVDKAIFDRILIKRAVTQAEAGRRLGYGKSAIGVALSTGRFSRRMAVGLHDAYGITPNDYAPKVPGVNSSAKPEIGVMRFDDTGREVRLDGTAKPRANPLDEALLPDGIYTLEFVDVRAGRRSGDMVEGYRFVTVASGAVRQPYYFSLFDKEPGGVAVNQLGAEWIRHLLRAALGHAYSASSIPADIVGHSVRAYLTIYERNGKRYNRTVWVEPLEPANHETTWKNALNLNTDSDTLRDALEYIVGELSHRRHES